MAIVSNVATQLSKVKKNLIQEKTMVFALAFWSWVLHQQMHQVSWNFSTQSNYYCSLNQIDFNEFQLSLCIMIPCRENWCLQAIFNVKCLIHTQIYWTHAFKIMIYLLGHEVPILFSQESIIKYLFEAVDFFNTLLKCKSLNPQQLIIGWSYSTSHLLINI